MREGWIEFTLEELKQDSLIGLVRSSAEQNSSSVGVPYLKMNNIDLIGNVQLSDLVYVKANGIEIDKYSLEFGDILINTRNSFELVGKSGIVRKLSGKVLFNNNIMRLRVMEEFDNFFVAYQLISPFVRKQMEKHKKATTSVCALYQRNLFQLKLNIPPLPEQRAIVARIEELFSELDHSISNLKSAQAKLENYRQAVLKKAFEGGFTESWASGRIKGPSKNFRLKDLVKTIDGDRGKNYPKKFELLENGFCLFLSTKNVRQGKFVFEENQFISHEKDDLLRGGKLERGDVVITTRGTLGNVALFDNKVPFDHVRINSGMLILRIKDLKAISTNFLMNFINSPAFTSQLKNKQSGTAQPQIPAGILKEIELFLPFSLEEQTQIVQEIESRLSVADMMTETIRIGLQKAEALRQSILKKAFEGKLLNVAELEACRMEADWEPAEKLLERIERSRNERIKSENSK